MTAHKYVFLDFSSFLKLRSILSGKICLALPIYFLMIACNSASPEKYTPSKPTGSQIPKKFQDQDHAQNQEQSATAGRTISKTSSSTDLAISSNSIDSSPAKTEDSSDLIIEHHGGSRLQLSPKDCRITASTTQEPKQVRWRWQLEDAPGRCDFARKHLGSFAGGDSFKCNSIQNASAVRYENLGACLLIWHYIWHWG